MTRCLALYQLLDRYRNDFPKALEVCGKEEATVRQIFEYMDFMDAHFPGWLDGSPSDKPPLSEKATRPLRAISCPLTFQKALEATQKTLETRKDPFTGEFVKNPSTKRIVTRVVAKVLRQAGGGQITPDDIPTTNVWSFPQPDPRFGHPYPGRIPGQIVASSLYYWGIKGGLVVDPMAGSGTTWDVCKHLGYNCLCYDLHPQRNFIKKNDLMNGLPKEAKGCHFIFFDPPYWKLKDEDYKEGSISEQSYYEFIESMELFVKIFHDNLTKGGIVALIIQDIMHGVGYKIDIELEKLGIEYLPVSINSFLIFREKLTPIYRVQVPDLQSIQIRQMEKFRSKKILINIARDLWIFKKR